jgi:hypothetical protein
MANNELVTPALWVALRNRQLTECLPADVRDYLRELHRLNILRNARLKVQATEVVHRLNAIGIEPILLKGAAALFVKTFTDPGSRMMLDLDILVPESAAQDCWETLCRTGYHPVAPSQERPKAGLPPIDYNRHHHLLPLHCLGDYGEVEVHRAAVPESQARMLPVDDLWANAESIHEGDACMGIPGPTDRILHNLVHSALVDRTYVRGRIALRSLHEMAELQARYRGRIDWNLIRQRFYRAGQFSALCGMLCLAHRYFAVTLPERTELTLGSRMHSARARLQARWRWSEQLVARILWFSAEDIRGRYQCGGDFWALTKGRIRLASVMAAKLPRKTLRWALNRFGMDKTIG